ncbi:MAG: hypothetical protein ABI533_09370 [Betaproteobacteria bacterium]
MAEYEAVPTGSTTQGVTRQPPVTPALVVYALFAFAAVAGIVGHGMLVGAPLLTLIGIIAVIVAYITRSDSQGTWVASHLTWLISTFWWSLLLNGIGWLLAITVIGLPVALAIWVATTIWVIYRVIRGYLHFHQSRPIPGL